MKHNLLNKITSLIVIMLVSFSGFSQTSIDAGNITEEWKLLTTKDGIEVHIKQDKCDIGADKLFTYAYIKLVNTTTVTKTVEFNFQLIFDNDCVGCGDTRETKHILQSPASAYIAGGMWRHKRN